MSIRVRYAPSPTGYLHIGGARTAIFNYLFAKNQGGKFIVRIEDTDLERNIPDGISSQLDNLRWLGLEIDETVDIGGPFAPYQQTERLQIYLNYAQKLVDEKKAYYCFCDQETIDQMKQEQLSQNIVAFKYDQRCNFLSEKKITENINNNLPYAIRVKVKPNHQFVIDDMVRDKVVFHTKDIGDFVIVKSNKIATYNFAVVIDDYLMKISHVLRGAEHISNTPRQLMIYEYFGWKAPRFGHLTLIINETGKKLSKRDNSVEQFIADYQKKGFLAPALFNFISLLGWSPHQEHEIFSIKELIAIFNSNYFSKAPSMFDYRKLLWMNNYYIKQLDTREYLSLVMPFVANNYDLTLHDNTWWEELLLIFQKQLQFGQEIVDLISMFFQSQIAIKKEEEEIVVTENSQKILTKFIIFLDQIEQWNDENINICILTVKKITGLQGKDLFMPIRIAITGQMHGPELVKTIKLLGKNIVKTRCQNILSIMKK